MIKALKKSFFWQEIWKEEERKCPFKIVFDSRKLGGIYTESWYV